MPVRPEFVEVRQSGPVVPLLKRNTGKGMTEKGKKMELQHGMILSS